MGGRGDDTLMGGFRSFNLTIATNGNPEDDDQVYTEVDDGCGDSLWGGDGQDRIYYFAWQDAIDGVAQWTTPMASVVSYGKVRTM